MYYSIISLFSLRHNFFTQNQTYFLSILDAVREFKRPSFRPCFSSYKEPNHDISVNDGRPLSVELQFFHLAKRGFAPPFVGPSIHPSVDGRSVGSRRSEMQLATSVLSVLQSGEGERKREKEREGKRWNAREGRGNRGSPGALSTDFSHPASQLRSRR